MSSEPGRIRLCASICPEGLLVGERTVPLHAARVDYFRLSRSSWRAALEAVKGLGASLVSVVVPWSVHERGRDDFDFGGDNPRLDVAQFLEIAHDVGLFATVSLGPCSSAELACSGVPERVVWTDACQALSPGGAPVIAPALPLAYPLPSLSSAVFQEEAALWLAAVARQLARLVWPGGPIVLSYVDVSLGTSFHGGPYDRDYHPDALAQYRRFLTQRYGQPGALRRAHRDAHASFDTVTPPGWLSTSDPDALTPHLDWCAFQDAQVAAAVYRCRAILDGHGLKNAAKACALPRHAERLSVDADRWSRVVDVVTLGAAHGHAERDVSRVLRDVSELAEQCADRGVPSVVSAAAGFAADSPAFAEREDEFFVLSNLAYGARGLDVEMAVQRDRWVGGPIDLRGRPRASADFWVRLFRALTRTHFHELTRRVSVRIVVPRGLEHVARLCRVLVHAPPPGGDGGPTAPFDDLLEGELDPTRGALTEAGEFIATLARVLDSARLPYAFTASPTWDRALEGGAWAIVVSPGFLSATLAASIAERMLAGARISVGPRPPELDDRLRPSGVRLPLLAHPVVPVLLPRGPSTLAELVETTALELGYARLGATPATVRTSLHHDRKGRPAVLFLLNESSNAVEATIDVPAASASDAIADEPVSVVNGRVTLTLPARSVRMLALD